MKPLIYFIDDEPNNLTVFEMALPDDWEVKVFSNPMAALEFVGKDKPTLIVSDQRMPAVSGVQLLEIAKGLSPESIRIIVTGYSEEELVIESVRKAQVFDYIKKPWEPDDLVSSLRRAIDFYNANAEAKRLQQELIEREAVLQRKNTELVIIAAQLEKVNETEMGLRKELECWVPPFLIEYLKGKNIQFPLKENLVGLTFDIVNSAALHGVLVKNKPIRSLIMQLFTEAVIKNSGWRESTSGDSAYAHFGLLNSSIKASDAAMAAAREFRVGLRSISSVHGLNVECGISLHLANNCLVEMHEVQVNSAEGVKIQKSFDTSSLDIDLLHRMEKITHTLPGSNIIMSQAFTESLGEKPHNLTAIGQHEFKGQDKPVELFLIPSDKVTAEDLAKIKTNVIEMIKKAA